MEMQIVVLLIWVAVVTVLYGALQVFLAGRKNKWWGLILPVGGLLLAAAITVRAVPYMLPEFSGTASGRTEENIEFSLPYIVDREDAIIAVGKLKLKDCNSGEVSYSAVKFDEDSNLMNREIPAECKNRIEAFLEERGGFEGESAGKTKLRFLYFKEHYKEESHLYNQFAITVSAWFAPVAVYGVIYFVMRKRVKRKFAAQGIEKMLIDDL